MKNLLLFLIINIISQLSLASNLMFWQEGEPVPENGFQNPYNLTSDQLNESVRRGRIHALQYPVSITGLIIPLDPVNNFFNNTNEDDPLKKLFRKLGLAFAKMNSLEDLMKWLGLHTFPDESIDDPVYGIPYPEGKNLIIEWVLVLWNTTVPKALQLVVLFAIPIIYLEKILGLTNRFPRANMFFVKGKSAVTAAPTSIFKWLTDATSNEKKMFARTKENINSVQAKKPIQLGLDTSLAHVALSLAHRREDAYATKDYWSYKEPREEDLAWIPSESKPGVWWNVKYKNKWLLDGSVISGNPILTNLLWNEIGRGSDLKELEQWFIDYTDIVRDLTNAVYHNEAPHFTDFFSAKNHFDFGALKEGQKLYNNMCAKCHGRYLKKWDLPDAHQLTFNEQLKTYKVIMPENTKVVDVGTDAFRFKAMKSLKQLNHLAISSNNNIQIKVQKGYVPPPLVGIWARWPYFHNNSVPSLCDVLSPSAERPKKYWAGEALDKNTDFNKVCNGYPRGDATPLSWQQNKEFLYNTNHRGKSNQGHDERIFIKNGKNILSTHQKMALVQFLQTL